MAFRHTNNLSIARRDFLKLSAATMGALGTVGIISIGRGAEAANLSLSRVFQMGSKSKSNVGTIGSFKKLDAQIMALPMIDCHCHVTDHKIWNNSVDVKRINYNSTVCEALTDLGGVGVFSRAGMTAAEQNAIRFGEYSREKSIRTLLKYMDDVDCTHHVIFCKKGMEIAHGIQIPEFTFENMMELDRRADEQKLTLGEYYDRGNIERVLLNMWNTLGISYYGKYMDEITPGELAVDLRCNSRIATFDYYSTAPFSKKTHMFAQMCGSDYDSFDEYDAFLEALAKFYVKKRGVVGFKVSEAYFRPLDYKVTGREAAKQCYNEKMTPEEIRTLADYTSLKIFDLARSYGIPVQFHTGQLWGSTNMAMINPFNLEPTIKLFPTLNFDLLHCGYPFTAEMGMLANNYNNVYININPMLKRSFEYTKTWFELFLNVTSSNHIMFGMDMFTPMPMIGGAYYTRVLVSEVMRQRVERGLLSKEKALRLAEKVLSGNAKRLYKLS
ncbi:MAG: amidohydrolase family protein [Kiritimatiellae bacterium]|nr:amidohydrolase family protein [Kiritimatiellia bacterium]